MILHFLRKHSVPVAIILFSILSYGLLIPFLGFYWDDWPMIWFAHSQGPMGFPATFAGDRPFLSLIYIITTSILQLVPWQWQTLGLISRILTSLAFWWSFSQLWPEQKQKMAWAALLFAVYAGFKQQPISVVYSNGYFLLAAYYLSFGFMVLAIRERRKYWIYTLVGVCAFIFCTFSTEYYFGLEMIRPVIIYLALSRFHPTTSRKVVETLKHWLPYLLPFTAFFFWRVFIFKFPTYQPGLINTLETEPIQGILKLVWRFFHDPILAGVEAWTGILRFPDLADLSLISTQIYWASILTGFALAMVFLKHLLPAPHFVAKIQDDQSIDQQLMTIGGVSLLIAGIPYWVTGLRLDLTYPFDRFTLAYMMGAALFATGFISWLTRTQWQKLVIIAILIGAAVGENILNANAYRREWVTHNDFFKQLIWRVPGLKPGTVLLTYEIPLRFYSDNSLTGPLNLLYSPENKTLDLDYYFAFLDVRLGRSIPELKPGLEIDQKFRNATFKGSTDNILVLFYSPPGCLRILDPKRDTDLRIMPKELLATVPISNPSVIEMTPNKPVELPAGIFGNSEGAHDWCYYYQKADLARQRGDWTQALELLQQAHDQGLYPREPSETLLIIEAYGMNGQWDRVAEIMLETYNNNQQFQRQFCESLTFLEQQKTSSRADQNKDILELLRGRLTCETVK